MEFNKNNTRSIMKIIAFTIILYLILSNIGIVGDFANNVFSIVFPFILGGIIAFILNIFVVFFETKVFINRSKKKKQVTKSNKVSMFKRFMSIVCSIIVLLLIISLVIGLVIPEIINTGSILIENLPTVLTQAELLLADLSDTFPQINEQLANLNERLANINQEVLNFIQNYGLGLLQSSFSVIGSFFGGIVNFVIGLVFAIYLLAQKETLLIQVKKLNKANMKKEIADKLENIGNLANKTFAKFITGQFFDAIILGILCFVGMLILQLPYAATISVLIAFTALIPIVGALIGTAIGALLIVAVSPIQALVFIIFLVILQQIEGNLVYPKIVGDAVGLPGIWVLVAVAIGGTLWGIPGMLIGVPTVSVIYSLLRDRTNRKLKEKKINI